MKEATVNRQAQLGEIWKDVVTEYEGIVVSRTEWLMGCARIQLQRVGTDKDGKPFEPHGFDEPFCVYVKDGPTAVMQRRVSVTSEPTVVAEPAPRRGGPRNDPSRF